MLPRVAYSGAFAAVFLSLLCTSCTQALSRSFDPAQNTNLDRLTQYRNLGKAFYENPTTQAEAVAEFKKALDLNPNSVRDQLNYGLALLRAAKAKEAVTVLENVQKEDASLPHTWFNLGIYYKREGQFDTALRQLQQMEKLVPSEP